MELAEIRPFEPQMAEIDLFTMPDAVGVGEPSVRKQKPYIKGHVTDGSSTFTFQVNGSDVTVSVSGGDWKYKPTDAITSLAFVGVPQLESLELNKITGVSTFNLDYPVVPVFKKCDATTEAALNYVYHIRGTATDDFDFILKYIDESNNVTTVTESAVIDGNGKWDVSYSGKYIYEMDTFYFNTNKNKITSFEFTEKLDYLHSFNTQAQQYRGIFYDCTNLTEIKFAQGTTFKSTTYCYNPFTNTKIAELDLRDATFEQANQIQGFLNSVKNVTTVRIDKIKSSVFFGNTGFASSNSLVNLYVPQDSALNTDLVLSYSPLSYDSMIRVAGWLKDLTGLTSKTVTFKADTYNALTAEQQAALTAIIVTQKGWNLATA